LTGEGGMATWTNDEFPVLTADKYNKTSEPTFDYNCVAWALGRTDINLGPPGFGYGWPLDCPSAKIDNFVEFFKYHGFKVSPKGEFETDKEKIVIFSNEGWFTHVAKLVKSGRWTSKLGDEMDCEHDLLAVEGPLYGSPDTYMERAIPSTPGSV